jgi:hypothetical protein
MNARDDDLLDDCIEKALKHNVKIVLTDKHYRFKDLPIAAILRQEREPGGVFAEIKNKNLAEMHLKFGGY